MRRIRTNAKDKRLHRELCAEYGESLGQFHTRLRNAVRVLSQVDNNFLMWLEGVDQSRPIEEITRTVEARARAIVIKNNFPSLNKTHIIFSEYPFSDRGTLIMG